MVRAADLIAPTQDGRFRRRFFESDNMRCVMLGYVPGDEVPYHAHERGDEMFLVISGATTLTVSGSAFRLETGDAAFVAHGEPHTIEPVEGPAVVLAVVAPHLDDAVEAQRPSAAGATPGASPSPAIAAGASCSGTRRSGARRSGASAPGADAPGADAP